MTTSSNAAALAYAATQVEARALGIQLIFGMGETVLPQARAIVAQRFGAQIAATYSSQEIGCMATQCPMTASYHIVTENAVVEILQTDGSPAEPGEIGQVVVTSLYNYAMPFIRYALGDVATAGESACICGRSLPLIASVDGRTRHAFVFEDGTRVWPSLWRLNELQHLLPFREFQMVQLDRQRIEIRYVPDGSDRAPDRVAIDAYVRAKIHPAAEVILASMEKIPRGPGGKLDPFLSMVE